MNSKTRMISDLKHKAVEAGYKRKKLPNSAVKKMKVDANPSEMDIDEIEGIYFQ